MSETPKAKADRIAAEQQRPQSTRVVRHAYHLHGHAKLHAPHNMVDDPTGPIVPFEVVLRLAFAIDSDESMDEVRMEVRDHIVEQLEKQGSPYLVGEVMVRGVSMLHRILVDADDPKGPAVRIMS